jgi:hypothetical protein
VIVRDLSAAGGFRQNILQVFKRVPAGARIADPFP